MCLDHFFGDDQRLEVGLRSGDEVIAKPAHTFELDEVMSYIGSSLAAPADAPRQADIGGRCLQQSMTAARRW